MTTSARGRMRIIDPRRGGATTFSVTTRYETRKDRYQKVQHYIGLIKFGDFRKNKGGVQKGYVQNFELI